jgi:hypothetical protein
MLRFQRACISLVVSTWKSIILTFECVVAEACGKLDGFVWRIDCSTTWAGFESRPTRPFCDFRPFDFRIANAGSGLYHCYI